MSERFSPLPIVLFGLLLALCVTLALAVAAGGRASADGPSGDGPDAEAGAEARPGASGATHPRFPSMDHGGSGPRRHGPVLGLAWAFGILQLALVVGCLVLGVRGDRVRAPLAAAGLLLALIVTMMVVSYRGFLADPTAAFLALPVPTAWFLYGFWPAQFLVVGLYILLFDRAIVTPQDMARFHEILARRASSGGSARRPSDPPGAGAVRRRRPLVRESAPGSPACGPMDPGRRPAPPAAG